MQNFHKINKLKRRVAKENPIAIGIELENGDMEFLSELEDGTRLEFYIPKKDTFVRCSKLCTQEWSSNILRHLKTEHL